MCLSLCFHILVDFLRRAKLEMAQKGGIVAAPNKELNGTLCIVINSGGRLEVGGDYIWRGLVTTI